MVNNEQYTTSELIPFFNRYAQAFEAYDQELLANCYNFPVTFDLADGSQVVFGNKQKFNENSEQLFLIYRASQIITFDVTINRVLKLNTDSYLVDATWLFLDQLGRFRQKLTSTYRVRDTSKGVKIVSILLENTPAHLANTH